MEIQVTLAQKSSKKIEIFEKKEWQVADLEHYGKKIDFTKKRYKFIAKTNEGKITGTLDLVIEANLAFIEGLIVGKAYQQKGVGSKLLKEAEAFSQKKHCTKIYLETNQGWTAEKFYKKNGYQISAVLEKHICNQTSLILTKFF